MTKNKLSLLVFLLVGGLTLTSCHTNKKIVALEKKVNILKKDSSETHSLLMECNTSVQMLQSNIVFLQTENDSARYHFKALTYSSKFTIADQAKQLKKFHDIIESQKAIMTKLKNTITDALVNYKTDELNVYIENGKVYVSLEEKLLFKSGSDLVDVKGKEALKTLALVLNNTQDIMVIIEGYTDNIPINTKVYKDNWDLSTARATSILRILTKDYGFDPKRITASGKGEFHPVNTNKTDVGRANNRRTEIILSPDLSELYKLLYK